MDLDDCHRFKRSPAIHMKREFAIRRRSGREGRTGSVVDPADDGSPQPVKEGLAGSQAHPAPGNRVLTAHLQMALEYVQEGVVVCDDTGETIFRNASANYLGVASNGILAEQAITEALQLALQGETAERTLELIAARASDGWSSGRFRSPSRRRPSGAVAIVQDASDRHRAGGHPARLRGQRQPRAENARRGAQPAGRDARR